MNRTFICAIKECNKKLLVPYKEQNEQRILRRLGPESVYCRSCAKNKFNIIIAKIKTEYITHSQILRLQYEQNQKKNNQTLIESYILNEAD